MDAPVEAPVSVLSEGIEKLKQATPETLHLEYMILKLQQDEAHHKETLATLHQIEKNSKFSADKLWYLERYLEAQEMDDHTLERKQKCEDALTQENFQKENLKRSQIKYIQEKEVALDKTLQRDWLACIQVASTRSDLRDQMTRENASGAMLGHITHRVMAGERRSEPSLHPLDYARVVQMKKELEGQWKAQETNKKALMIHLKELERVYLPSIKKVIRT